MSRYRYLGPFHELVIDGQKVAINEEFDAADDIFIEAQRRRGFHIFQPLDSEDSGPVVPSLAGDPAPPPAAVETPEPAPEPTPEEPPAEEATA